MSPESSVRMLWVFFHQLFHTRSYTLKVQRRMYRHSYGMGWLCHHYCCYNHSHSNQFLAQNMDSLPLGRVFPLSQTQHRLSGKANVKSVGRGSPSTLFLRNNFLVHLMGLDSDTGKAFLLDFIFQTPCSNEELVPNHLGWQLKHLISCTCNGASLFPPLSSPDALHS